MPRSPASSLNAANSVLFREALSRFATGVTVVTARSGKDPTGVTISSFAGVSLKPPLVLFCLDEKSSALAAFKRGAIFAVHVLAEDQAALAHIFARTGKRDWKKIALRKNERRAPVLDGAMAVLLCRFDQKHQGGDHAIITGRVLEIAIDPKKPRPLLHTQRNYWGLGKKK